MNQPTSLSHKSVSNSHVADKRKPQKAPGPAYTEGQTNDDFTLPAALYHDAIQHFHSAVLADAAGNMSDCDCYKRSALLAAFSFFEAQLNQVAFAYAATHRDALGQIELDVLEEKETVIDDRGDILRKSKFYRTEARFLFLASFLSGQDFDRSGDLWQRFQVARELRDRWTHPKPPFDTWGLDLTALNAAIIVTRDMFIRLADMMNADPPMWLRPVGEIIDQLKQLPSDGQSAN